jgi:hypothetical protein
VKCYIQCRCSTAPSQIRRNRDSVAWSLLS